MTAADYARVIKEDLDLYATKARLLDLEGHPRQALDLLYALCEHISKRATHIEELER